LEKGINLEILKKWGVFFLSNQSFMRHQKSAGLKLDQYLDVCELSGDLSCNLSVLSKTTRSVVVEQRGTDRFVPSGGDEEER